MVFGSNRTPEIRHKTGIARIRTGKFRPGDGLAVRLAPWIIQVRMSVPILFWTDAA